jgi:hypothetical protein
MRKEMWGLTGLECRLDGRDAELSSGADSDVRRALGEEHFQNHAAETTALALGLRVPGALEFSGYLANVGRFRRERSRPLVLLRIENEPRISTAKERKAL